MTWYGWLQWLGAASILSLMAAYAVGKRYTSYEGEALFTFMAVFVVLSLIVLELLRVFAFMLFFGAVLLLGFALAYVAWMKLK